MTIEQFRAYQEQTFDSFCKTLIRNESADAFRELSSRASREVGLSSLSMAELSSLRVEDNYCPYTKTFYVNGQVVEIKDWELGNALQYLMPERRNVLLLFYFLGYTESQISKLLRISTGTVNYRRIMALRRLRELIEVLRHED